MKVAGFTIIRNAIKFDYPIVEAIRSILPLCDHFYIGLGQSEDGTEDMLKQSFLKENNITVLPSVWDDSLRTGGLVLSVETNKVFDKIPAEYDWCFYIQSDECVHENDLEKIYNSMKKHRDDKRVQGLLFNYLHFYGSYDYVGDSRRWYRKEIRIIRNDKHIRSYKDAQGFRTADNKKLRVAETGAYIYHYGWVKPPERQQEKQKHFHKMWHDDEWMKKNIPQQNEFDYSKIDYLNVFSGTHPEVMKERIRQMNWKFEYDPKRTQVSLKNRILYWIEKKTGWRPGENKNYVVVV
jgi:hypothetical protein